MPVSLVVGFVSNIECFSELVAGSLFNQCLILLRILLLQGYAEPMTNW